jgi:protein arginine kinase activator
LLPNRSPTPLHLADKTLAWLPRASYDRKPMKCDLCDKPAVVHEVTVNSGVKNELHLCEEHARAHGIALPGHQPINQLLTQFTVSQTPSRRPSSARKACPSCGLRFAQFRQSGVLGCSDCYETFERQLTPMIERAQNGGTSHAGKCPRRVGTSLDRQLQIRRLVKEMEEAVAAEQYERAAELRDQLQDMEQEVRTASSMREVKDQD